MNIPLPTRNLNASKLCIRNGILYLRHGESYTNVIYRLTYFMKGHNYCYYCKKMFPKSEITMDHMYPRSVGGPTIPQNLLPSCKECNGKKSFMNYEQYQEYLTLNESSQSSYMSKAYELVEGYKKIGMYQIPSEWITPFPVDKIHTNTDFANVSTEKFDKIKKYYETYGSFQSPVILDRKHYCLDNFYILFVAKSLGIEYLPVIILDNVEMR